MVHAPGNENILFCRRYFGYKCWKQFLKSLGFVTSANFSAVTLVEWPIAIAFQQRINEAESTLRQKVWLSTNAARWSGSHLATTVVYEYDVGNCFYNWVQTSSQTNNLYWKHTYVCTHAYVCMFKQMNVFICLF